MVPSITLMWCWLVIAENHRAFQQASESWLVAIEQYLGLGPSKTVKVKGNRLNRWLTRPGAIQSMRWWLCLLLSAAWIIVLLGVSCGWW